MAAVRVHDPEGGHGAGLGAAECDVAAIRGFGGAAVPNGRIARSQAVNRAIAGAEAADLRAAARHLRLAVAVEVVGVRALGLILPRDLRVGQPAGDQDGSVEGPGGHVGSTASMLRIPVGRCKPVGLPLREESGLSAIRAADADIGPVMAGIRFIAAVLVENPLTIRRPARSEEEMVGIPCEACAVGAVDIARPDLVPAWTREMERDATAVRAEAQSVGQSLACARKLPRVCAIEVHAEDLPDPISHYLHENTIVAHEQGRGIENGKPLPIGDLSERLLIEVVDPEVRGSLRIVLLKRTSRTVTPLLHAQEDHAATIGEERTRLPGDLVGHFEIEGVKAGAVGIDDGGLACRGEEEARFAGGMVRCSDHLRHRLHHARRQWGQGQHLQQGPATVACHE